MAKNQVGFFENFSANLPFRMWVNTASNPNETAISFIENFINEDLGWEKIFDTNCLSQIDSAETHKKRG